MEGLFYNVNFGYVADHCSLTRENIDLVLATWKASFEVIGTHS